VSARGGKRRWRRTKGRGEMRLIGVILSAMLAASCSTYRKMPVEEKLIFLEELEEQTLAELVEQQPEAQAELDRSVGHAVFSNTTTKVPIVGAGDGIGVVVDTTTDERTYLKVGRLDVGGGLGVRKYRLIIIFFEEEALRKLASGKVELGAGVEAGAGKEDVGTGAGGIAGSRNEDYVLYQLSEAGVSATFTVRAIRYSVLDLEE